jgi:hypothetical protein
MRFLLVVCALSLATLAHAEDCWGGDGYPVVVYAPAPVFVPVPAPVPVVVPVPVPGYPVWAPCPVYGPRFPARPMPRYYPEHRFHCR